MARQVVKVGGSLLDWPGLRGALPRWLSANAAEETWIVAGGGPFVDAVRAVAAIHRLDDEFSHWLALHALRVSTTLLAGLIGESNWRFIDPVEFCRGDDAQPGAVPHSWAATSDSIAARVAETRAAELVLLKSAPPPPGDAADWARTGFVDPHFPVIVSRGRLAVRAINLREF